MLNRFLPVALIGIAVVAYQIGSRNLGSGSSQNPWQTCGITYFMASLLCAILGFFFRGGAPFTVAGFAASLPYLTLLALGCVGVEVGYLYLYRGGWKLTEMLPVLSLTNNLMLAGVGFFFFRETLSAGVGAGLAMVIAGVALMHWK
jgi:drug/metabolite transporter (DMT)-like permease